MNALSISPEVLPYYTNKDRSAQLEELFGYKCSTITFQITGDCCMACTYCYQQHKGNSVMKFETAKKFIDNLLNNKYPKFTTEEFQAIIVEFIGGEPLLEAKLIEQIIEYFITECVRLDHPWTPFLYFSMSSNGLLYFDKDVQHLFHRYDDLINYSVSIDGNKELHDACRLDLNGNGTYDRAIAAVHAYNARYGSMPGIKMTLFPTNLLFLYDSVLNLIEEGYKQIYLNCVFENVWTDKDATLLYEELKRVADYFIENDLQQKIFFSMFDPLIGQPINFEEDNKNWCGGVADTCLAVESNGNIAPCIRYFESSLKDKQPPLILGTVDGGYLNTSEQRSNYEMLSNITYTSQSTEECIKCRVASGCAWCSAYNYEETGTPNKRVTYICKMHKARVLVNYYYYNRLYRKLHLGECPIKLNLTWDECSTIIPQAEYKMLQEV